MLWLLQCHDEKSSSGESSVPQIRSIGQFLLSRLFSLLTSSVLRSGFTWVKSVVCCLMHFLVDDIFMSIFYCLYWSWSWSYDRQSVGQFVLVSGFYLEPITRFFFCLTNACFLCGAPSLTGVRICNLFVQLLLSFPEQSLSGPSATELATIFYCFIWESHNLEGQASIFISPRKRVAKL
jgi:hypothetical protein